MSGTGEYVLGDTGRDLQVRAMSCVLIFDEVDVWAASSQFISDSGAGDRILHAPQQ